jgi:hypothetical protein
MADDEEGEEWEDARSPSFKKKKISRQRGAVTIKLDFSWDSFVYRGFFFCHPPRTDDLFSPFADREVTGRVGEGGVGL